MVEEPGGLQSMGSQTVGHDWATSLSLSTFMHWRRKWQSTPVLLPGESQGREPGGLPSMGSHRVGHDWSDLAARTLRDRNATDHWPMFIQMRSKKSLREPSEAWSMGQKIENSPIYSVNNTIQVITLDSKLYLFYYFFSSFIFKVQLCVKRE